MLSLTPVLSAAYSHLAFVAMEHSTSPRPLLRTQYLVAYNLLCSVLWLAVLGRVILLVPLVGYENIYDAVGQLVKWTQTLAVLEVGHSAFSMSYPLVKSFYPSTFASALL